MGRDGGGWRRMEKEEQPEVMERQPQVMDAEARLQQGTEEERKGGCIAYAFKSCTDIARAFVPGSHKSGLG